MPQFRFAIPAVIFGACVLSLEISAADISGSRGNLLGMSIEQAEQQLAGSEDLTHCNPKPSRASGCLEFIERGSPDTDGC